MKSQVQLTFQNLRYTRKLVYRIFNLKICFVNGKIRTCKKKIKRAIKGVLTRIMIHLLVADGLFFRIFENHYSSNSLLIMLLT